MEEARMCLVFMEGARRIGVILTVEAQWMCLITMEGVKRSLILMEGRKMYLRMMEEGRRRCLLMTDASASRTRSNNAKVQSTGLFGWLARMGSGLHSVVEDNAAESGAGQETSGAGPGSATEGAGPGSTIDALTKQNTAEAARSNAPATKPAPVSKVGFMKGGSKERLRALEDGKRRYGTTDVPTEPEVPPEERMLEVRNAAMLSKNKAKAQLMNRDASLRFDARGSV
eukprot:gene3123-3958_t